MSDGLPPSMSAILAPPAQPEQSVFTDQPNRLVQFLTTGVPPPSDLYLSPDDSLRAELYSQYPNVQVSIKMRYVSPSGEMMYEEEQLLTAALPATTQQDFKVGEAFLLSVAAVVTGQTMIRGQVYCTISYIRAVGGPQASFVHTLVQGYVTSTQRVSWPVIQVDSPISGQGDLVVHHVAAPPTGQDLVFTTASYLRSRVQGILATFNASSQTGTREVVFQILIGGRNPVYISSAVQQAPSSGMGYVACPGVPFAPSGAPSVLLPLPVNLFLPPQSQIVLHAIGGQSLDYWGAGDMLTEEWIDM